MLLILGGTGFQPVVFGLTDGQDARPTVRQTEPRNFRGYVSEVWGVWPLAAGYAWGANGADLEGICIRRGPGDISMLGGRLVCQ